MRTHLNMLLVGLVDKGFNVQFYYSCRDERYNLPSELVGISRDISVENKAEFLSKIIFFINIIIKSYRWNDEDIIHAHGFVGFVSAVFIKMLGARNKVVVTLHGGALHTQGIIHYLLRRLISIMYRQISYFICVSEHDKHLHSLMNIPENLLIVIENAINVRQIEIELRGKSNPYSQNFLNFVIISTLYENKGVLEFVKDLNNNHVFDPDIHHITLIGTGPQKDEIVSTISKSLYLSKLVSYLGFVFPPYHYMKWADVLLFPSRKETFGLVLFEALYLQTKVIAHKQPTTEVHLDEANLANFDNMTEVKEAIDHILKKPKPKRFRNHGIRL